MARFNVITPEGQTVSIDESELQDALSAGWQVETPDQAEQRVIQEELGGPGGQLASAGLGALRGLTFGLSDLFIEGSDILTAEDIKTLKNVNPISSAVGEVGAVVGGTLLSGGTSLIGKAAKGATTGVRGAIKAGNIVENIVAKSLADSLAKKTGGKLLTKALSKAAGGATEGVLLGSTNLISEASLGDPEEVAERALGHLGMSALIGGGLGAIFSPIAKSKVLDDLIPASSPLTKPGDFKQAKRVFVSGPSGTVSQKAPKDVIVGEFAKKGKIADFLDKFSSEQAIKAMGFSRAQARKIFGGVEKVREIGRFGRDYVIKKGDFAGKKIVEAFDSFDDIFKKLSSAREEIGGQIGGIRGMVDDIIKQDEAYAPNIGRIFQNVDNFIKEAKDSFLDIELKRALKAKKAIEGLRQAKEEGKFIGTREIWKLRRTIDKIIFPKGGAPVPKTKDAFLKIRMILEEEIEETIKNVSQNAGPIGLFDEYKKLKSLFANAELSFNAAKQASAAESVGAFLGFTDKVAGVFGGGLGSVAGGFGGGIAGAAAAGVASKAVRDRGPAILADYLNRASKYSFISGSANKFADGFNRGVSNYLDKVSGKKPQIPKAFIGIKAVDAMLSTSEKKKSKSEKMRIIDSKIKKLTNPEEVSSFLDKQVGPISSEAPEVSTFLKSKILNAISLLNRKFPKKIDKNFLLNPTFDRRKYSDSETYEISKYIYALNNPLSIFDELLSGKVKRQTVEVLREVYPVIYERVKEEVSMGISEGNVELSYNDRIQLSILFGKSLDNTIEPEFINFVQSNYGNIVNPTGKKKETGEERRKELKSKKTDFDKRNITQSQFLQQPRS